MRRMIDVDDVVVVVVVVHSHPSPHPASYSWNATHVPMIVRLCRPR